MFREVVLVAALVSSCIAQEAPAQPSITKITTQTELVLIPVVVKEKSGAHIADLRRDDFEIEENGKPQKIATFEEVRAEQHLKTRQRNKNEVVNYLPDDDAAHRLIIIVLDLANTPYLTQEYARTELLKALANTVNTEDPKALLALTRNGVRVLHDFTADPGVLAAALRASNTAHPTSASVDPGPVASETDQLRSFGSPVDSEWDMLHEKWVIENTLKSLQEIAHAFEGVPGRKALIWASVGFPFRLNEMPSNLPQTVSRPGVYQQRPALESDTSMFSSYEKTWQIFNSANVSLYAVDLRGLVNEAYRDVAKPGPSGTDFVSWLARNNSETAATLVNFSEKTGGKAWVGASDVAKGFQVALDDSRSYYLLGYYLDRKQTKTGWNKLRVKVNRSGAEVRARSGFLLSELSSSSPISVGEGSLAPALNLNYTALPVALRLEPTPAAAGRRIDFFVTVPPGGFTIDTGDNNHAALDISAVITDAKGEVKSAKPKSLNLHLKPESIAQIQAGGLIYHNFVDVSAPASTIHVVVRDLLNGHVGSVSAPLN